jgi:hypothetical protein
MPGFGLGQGVTRSDEGCKGFVGVLRVYRPPIGFIGHVRFSFAVIGGI